MTLLSRDDLRTLLEVAEGPALSIFLPTERRGAETQQNPIRFKNLLRQAESQLTEYGSSHAGADKAAVEALLEPLRRMVDDHELWQHQSDGLAVFRTREFLRTHRLPERFAESVVVNDRFYLKPLFTLLRGDGRFYVLALSLNHVRLFEASRYQIEEIDLGPEVPRSLEEVVGAEVDEVHLQVHSRAGGSRGAKSPIFHGQGGGEDDQKEEVRRFFHRVDQAIQGYLEDRNAPLVLAAVEVQIPIYREASALPHVMHEGVIGNPDNVRPEELHERAWDLVRPVLLARREQDVERFQDMSGSARVSHRLDEVLPAAFDGRVETLFVADDQSEWGRFDPEKREIQFLHEPGPGSDDLLDLAAVRTFVNGGTVYALDPAKLPKPHQPVAAIFRY